MDRLFQVLMALACFVMISALWLGALGLLATVLMQILYGFSPLSLSAWKTLSLAFQQGGTVPLGFILYGLAAVLLAGAGEAAILWRLPSIAASMPSPSLPGIRLSPIRLSRAPARARPARPAKPRAEPVLQPLATPPPPPEPPNPAPAPAPDRPPQERKPSDSAILGRILALFDVWNEPPPAWMAEALRDEVVLLSPDAWPTLESLGSQGLDLLVTLREHGMLPESPAALRAIGEIEDLLRNNVGAGLNAGETAPPAPTLTLAASWLCEALDNVLAAQGEPAALPDRLPMAQTMFDRALRSMSDADWASLDRFPEKARRIRVLSDRLREEMRAAGARAASPPATPAEAVIALLKHFGFMTDAAQNGSPLLAHRDDLRLLLQIVDLQGSDWLLPKGLLGPWLQGSAQVGNSPARLLWQQLARRRLREADTKPLLGLLVIHGGRIEQEGRLAELVAADRRRSGIGLAWLSDSASPLPSLERELSALPDRLGEERRRARTADHSASSP